jgi:hypothetical protein
MPWRTTAKYHEPDRTMELLPPVPVLP